MAKKLRKRHPKNSKGGKALQPAYFLLTVELAERLRLFAFEKDTNKSEVARAALDAFLKARGY